MRTRCDAPNFHVDYAREVGTNALTLMTPLEDFPPTEGFQLLYQQAPTTSLPPPTAPHPNASGEGGTALPPPPRQYAYRKGEAIVFGASFVHSTEPGAAADPAAPHVYLCFTFGTDKPEHWPAIAGERAAARADRTRRSPPPI